MLILLAGRWRIRDSDTIAIVVAWGTVHLAEDSGRERLLGQSSTT